MEANGAKNGVTYFGVSQLGLEAVFQSVVENSALKDTDVTRLSIS